MLKKKHLIFTSSVVVISILSFGSTSYGFGAMSGNLEGNFDIGGEYTTHSSYFVTNNGNNNISINGEANASSMDVESITISPSQTIEATGLDASISIPSGVSLSIIDQGAELAWDSEVYTDPITATYNIPSYDYDLGANASITGVSFSDQATFNLGSTSYSYFTEGSTN
ncbi:hypothetical protein [Bacillus sp. Marseille-P3800]|uniref:hypothetical protein n=1 Tax=Bacillus sp. Marseille-P3800 TaxID=2014782 RepID=UPI000C06F40B|nr:hypothetical protein [Bacillus sp. Marseille-P3800]